MLMVDFTKHVMDLEMKIVVFYFLTQFYSSTPVSYAPVDISAPAPDAPANFATRFD